jgi:sigma-E factor negative regulatory protein RseC
MIETPAVVVRLEGGLAHVESFGANGCGSCSPGKSCATASLGKLFGAKPRLFRALNQIGAKAGDSVVVGIADGALLRGSLAVYLLPLVLLVAGALIATWLAPGTEAREPWSIVGAAAGLVAGVIWLKLFTAKIASDPHFQPVVLRKTADRVFQIIQEG